MNIQQQAGHWIARHEAELVADIRRLVTVRSVSKPDGSEYPYGRGCARALDRFLEIGRGWGFEAANCDYHCASLLLRGPEDGLEVGLWTHLDVVDEGDGWTFPPYDCRRVGDFIIGRGTQDNKGPGMAALYAMRCLRELGVALPFHLRLIAGCNEEAGMADIPYYLERNPAPKLSLIADCGFPVCHGEKGICGAKLETEFPAGSLLDITGGAVSNVVPDAASLTLRAEPRILEALEKLPKDKITVERDGETVTLGTRGIAGHVAFPEGSLNAIGVLCGAVCAAGMVTGREAEILAFLARVCGDGYGEGLGIDCRDDLSGRLTCSGSVVRVREGRLTLTLNIRYPIKSDGAAMLATLEAAARAAGFSLRVGRNSAPHYFDRESPVVETLMVAYQEVTGDTESLPYVMGGGTYARMLPDALGFGPGLPADYTALDIPAGRGGCHGPDEAQSIPNLATAVQVYVLALASLGDVL